MFNPSVGTDLGELIRQTRMDARMAKDYEVAALCTAALSPGKREDRAKAWWDACLLLEARARTRAEDAWLLYRAELVEG